MQDALNIKTPTVEPRATDEIKEMLEIIDILEKKGYCYVSQNGVYFDTSKFKVYKKLFRKNVKIEEEEDYSSSNFSDDKRNKEDFVLWKKKKEGEPYWPSKWGDGRPGWDAHFHRRRRHHRAPTVAYHRGGSAGPLHGIRSEPICRARATDRGRRLGLLHC